MMASERYMHEVGWKRIACGMLASALLIFSTLSLIFQPTAGDNKHWLHVSLDVATLIISVFGLIGAFAIHTTYLLAFEILCWLLTVLGAIRVTIGLVDDVRARTLMWDLIVTAALMLGAFMTNSLRKVASDYEQLSHGPAAGAGSLGQGSYMSAVPPGHDPSIVVRRG